MSKTIINVILATLWISVSEFARNQFFLMNIWVEHYKMLGFDFPANPINGAIWGVWSLLFAIFINLLTTRFTKIESVFISWLAGFVMMWLVIGNLGVLPLGILVYSIPLSLLESYVAVLICSRGK